MTDKELLAICQTAFEAITDGRKSYEVLRKLNRAPDSKPGFGPQVLSATMAAMIDEHLQGGL